MPHFGSLRRTADPFGAHQLRFFRSVLPAVPTKKLKWDVV